MLLGAEVVLQLGPGTMRLRPTLRAAMALERRFGGFDRIIRDVADGNMTVMADVVEMAGEGSPSLVTLISAPNPRLFGLTIDSVSVELARFILMLAGVDPDAADDEAPRTGERVSFAEHHTRLFRIGTGWLGWSAEDTWEATPAEIIEAYSGRVEMLKAIFGGKNDDGGDGPSVYDDTRDEAAIAKLKVMAQQKIGKAV